MCLIRWFLFIGIACVPALVYAAGAAHVDAMASMLFWIMWLFVLGIVGRYVAYRFQQPAVLGELLMGVLLGNACTVYVVPQLMLLREGPAVFDTVHQLLFHPALSQTVSAALPQTVSRISELLQSASGLELLQIAQAVDIFSRYGVIFLLFMVGLESSVEEISHTGRESFRVALIGVICPLLLGFGIMYYGFPEAGLHANVFVAATLSATSVGITARVLKEMQKMQTREAKTILGAAVIDDILGLVILAVVSHLVVSGVIDGFLILQIVASTGLYFCLALWLGPKLLRQMVRGCYFLAPAETKLVVAFAFLMLLSWLATFAGLSSIIGAFTAGLILHDDYFPDTVDNTKPQLLVREVMAPLEALFAPLFFMLIGIQVKIETFASTRVLLMAAGLLVAAVLGKLLSGLGASKQDDRWLVGIGMLPRGEVGLVFASIGRTLGVISDDLFSAIVLMVIVTTCIAPSWIKARFNRNTESQQCG